MNELRRRGRTVLLAAGLLLYLALSLYSHGAPEAKALGAALSIGPLLAVLLFVLWRSAPWGIAAGGTVAVGALLWVGWGAFERHYEWSDLIQQVLIYALIAVLFARSLGAGQVPVLAQIAAKTHGPIEADESAYLRRATAAWAIFYAFIAASIAILFFVLSPRAWSIFTDVVVFIAIALMVVIEHLLRRRHVRRAPAGGLARALRQALIG